MTSIKALLKPNLGHLVALTAVALSVVGIEAISTAPVAGYLGGVAKKQMFFLGLSICAMMVVAVPHHYERIGPLSYLFGLITLGLLLFLLVPGVPQGLVPVRGGAKRWINLQVLLFQPSEMAKIVFVLCLAWYLRHQREIRPVRRLILPFAMAIVPMGLIVIEPDLGTGLIFLPVLFCMLFVAGAAKRYLGLIILIGVISVPVIYPVLKPHQKSRIESLYYQLIGDQRYVMSSGFQAHKAMEMVGAGQVEGLGKTQATKILRYNRLPEAHNDMIFSVISARWGLIGSIGLLGLYLLLISLGIVIAAIHRDLFGRLVVVGVMTVFFTQVVVNVGMTIGVLPITGMTLPFISYGGSSLLINFVMIGLVLNVASRQVRTSRG